MQGKLWEFIDQQATFSSDSASQIKFLYFPLCNTYPFMSSITPDLHGDIKIDFNSFLLEPVTRLSLTNSKSSRNFWIYINPRKVWSLTGVSKDIQTLKEDKFNLKAGLLWHKITRSNKKIGLKAEITSLVPSSGEPVEIMLIEITNASKKPVKFIPTAAIPLYARPAHNLHDHRHVTSLLNRIKIDKFGIILKPTLVFNETGHRKNENFYFALGSDENNKGPQYIYPAQDEFTGEGSDLEAPDAVLKNLSPAKRSHFQGKEPMAGLKFKPKLLPSGQSTYYIIIMGIEKEETRVRKIFKKFDSRTKIEKALEENKSFWQEKSCAIKIDTKNNDFDNWFKWVNIQPFLRKIFGCSFLPDFDYGKGGRGWRDLWQDCLALILNNPEEVRQALINNFSGVRIDGSNATIIDQKNLEFIADRNNITRVWMDHGVWPLITTYLYIHQTGDLKILLEEATYFRDPQLCRGKENDRNWAPEYGNNLKTKEGKIYKGSILEHILVENLVQFFNVGAHNHVLLEDADWNDGLDMARANGESVAFSCMYAQNLKALCELIEKLRLNNITVFKELSIFLDTLTKENIDYFDINAKRKLLGRYFQCTKYEVSGKKISLSKDELIKDLKRKSEWMSEHIRKNEWLNAGFFNGYYNNDKQPVEGNINGLMRMTLTGQVFAVMSGIATAEQVKILFSRAKKYLQDKNLKGFHLNTDFSRTSSKISGGIPPNLGRAFSFIYGEKENGAFFSHMAVMFAYALYKRGFVNEGYEVINSIYKMALDTKKSKTYPCLPEYFNAQGRGMYCYLTGSASWFVLTLLTQVFGVKGEYGDLLIEPKLTASQFKKSRTISITLNFAHKRIEIAFINPRKKDYGSYLMQKLSLNGKIIAENIKEGHFFIPRSTINALANQTNLLEITID